MVLVIRRLGCPACDRIHHELPDCLVPYKRYDVESIEAGILEGTASAVAADESTIARWRRWFATWVVYAVGCLRALQARAGLQRIQDARAACVPAVLGEVSRWVGDAAHWLARIVRPIANAHLWCTDPFPVDVPPPVP